MLLKGGVATPSTPPLDLPLALQLTRYCNLHHNDDKNIVRQDSKYILYIVMDLVHTILFIFVELTHTILLEQWSRTAIAQIMITTRSHCGPSSNVKCTNECRQANASTTLMLSCIFRF